MKVYIKNMVCQRCKLAVAGVLQELELPFQSLELGEVTFPDPVPQPDQLAKLGKALDGLGFEIINDRKAQLIENIKKAIMDVVHRRDEFTKIKLSDYLEQNLHYDFSYLSGLFSAVEGTTIEQYWIRQRIERAKELLVYDQKNLTEISHDLGYSSVAHLSRQFKQVTGMTPTRFRALKDPRNRKPLDEV